MPIWFLVCAIGFLSMIPLHFWSVEYQGLQRRYGKRGIGIGKILGTLSGWMELVFLIGFWISPQPRFILLGPSFSVPLLNFQLSLLHLAIALPLLLVGAWIAIRGVIAMSAEVGFGAVDAHTKPSKIVTSGPYSTIRQPQYLGAVLAHVGGAVLLSASYALLFAPVYLLCNYLIAWKEERELVREFGKGYKKYQEKTPMFIPRFWKR